MIIFPSAFVLSAAAANVPLTYPRILYNNLLRSLAASAVTATTETADGPKDAVLRPDTAEYWQPSALPATITIDLGAARSIDSVGLAGHTIGSSGAAVLVETSDNTFVGSPSIETWTALASGVAPADDSPLLFLDAARTISKIRVTITGVGAVPRLAVIYAGVSLVMEKEIADGFSPFPMARQTVLSTSMSRGGQFLGQGFRRFGVSNSVMFRDLTDTWVRAYFDAFSKSARSLPYFFAWDALDYPSDVGYVWTDKDIVPAYNGTWNWMDVSWQMTGTGSQ